MTTPIIALTPEQRETFEGITQADNIALVRGEYQARPAAFICAVVSSGTDYQIHPLAVLLSDAELDRCTLDGEAMAA